jgi:PPE-repeat protein
MDFGAIPPEINSARMYSGNTADSMLTAAAAWDKVADDLYCAAASYQSIVTSLTDEDWRGPASDSMAAAVGPYMSWLTSTAAQAKAIANQARAAVSAYETASAAVVPPPLIEANRAQLAQLIAGNVVSQDTPAITAVEAEYGEMWAQDACTMYRYAAASATAATLTPLAPPALGGSSLELLGSGADTAATASAQDALAQLTYALPRVLHSLAQPVQSTSAISAITGLFKLTSISSPVGAFASAISSPMSMTASGTSAALSSLKALGSPQMAVSSAVGQGISVGRMSVPPSWDDAAFGSLRSIA